MIQVRLCVRTLAALAFVVSTASSLMWGQGAASLRGLIADPQKSAVPAAKVTLTEMETGSSRTVLSSSTGEYQFAQIRPGTYLLAVEAPGFAVHKVGDVKLLVDTPTTIDVLLQLASSNSVVMVTADTPQVNTVDATVGNAFQEHQIQSMPLQTRNVVQLLSLQPGVTQSGEVMGARKDQNNIMLDGIDNNDNQNPLSGLNGTSSSLSSSGNPGFTSALPVPLDSVQEFRVTVAGENAFAGRSSGGQVQLVTRSGSNELHGSAYEYNRNTAYTANNWFNNRAGLARPQLIRNQFGATLGGPVKKNRVFYFLNYETRLDSSQLTASRTVPSETLKQGLIQFKTTNGNLYTLTPSDIAAIDPLHIGETQTMLKYLSQFPSGNSPALASDQGLNFNVLRFNAPVKLDYRTYVGRFDWMMDAAAKHTMSLRGTLSNNGETNTSGLAQFPGQAAASQYLSDNRGFGLRYTGVLSPTVTNTANVGLTRIGYGITGSNSPSLSFGGMSGLENFVRGSGRINPTWNFTDDVSWIKSKHTLNAGINFRWIDNRVLSYGSAYPSYAMSRGVLLGLGQDIYSPALAYVANGSALALSNSTAVTNAFGTLLGLVNSYSATYQFQKDGSTLAFGQPRQNDFVTRNYEFYVQDSWKITPKLSLNYGLHYEFDKPPYEIDGLQVATTPGLDVYFGTRAYAAANGIPGNQLPNGDRLTYDLSGPGNGKPSWYKADKNNFAPRLSLAYSHDQKTVFRLGGALLYDQYGNDLVANVASLGSVGLSTTLSNPTSYNFTTSPRYGTGVLPALPAAPAGGFPYTPGNISAISGTYYGVDPSLKAPFSYLFNASMQRQLKEGFTLEVGYVGRLSKAQLIQRDAFAPAIYFKDPKSGQTWAQASGAMQSLYVNGLTATAAKANPSLVPTNAFIENMFPALANYYFPGSATANYFNAVYGVNAGSHLDALHQFDRVTSAAYPNCIVATGCYTFFAPQGSADPTWTNAGNASYHGMIVTVRHPLSRNFSFDFNYTWSHSIDNGSGTGSGSNQFGGILQNVFNASANRGPSDFDIRHLFNANAVYMLPVGKGQKFLTSAPKWLDEVVGGWQVSGLMRLQSGLPSTIGGTGTFNSNYWNGTRAILRSGTAPQTGFFYDNNGNPSIFSSTTAINSYMDDYPGGTGTRGLIRLPWQKNVDLTVTKDFTLPWERHRLQFRADAFNAFNFVNFTSVSLSLATSGTFGEFSAAQDARVLQLALRYSF